MYASSDAVGGSPSFTIKVEKVATGYKASTEGTTVPPSVARTEGDAIQAHTKALYEAVSRGDIFAPDGQR
jgi:hypothetical protein